MKVNTLVIEKFLTSKSIKEDLLREWQLWSKCFGKVFIINGTSSSGKTTLTKYLNKFGFNLVSSDDIYEDYFFDYINNTYKENISLARSFLSKSDMLKIFHGFKIQESNYKKHELMIIHNLQQNIHSIPTDVDPFSSPLEIFDRIYDKAARFIFSGQNVVIDRVIIEETDISMLSYSFRNYPMTIGILYIPLEKNLQQCFSRNYISSKNPELDDYRYPEMIIKQYTSFYKFVTKDNISKYDKVLEKIDKCIIDNILELAMYHGKYLLSHLKHVKVYSNEVEDNIKIKELTNTIKAVKKAMMLDTHEEVFVVPAVKYNFIIKGPDLKILDTQVKTTSNSLVVRKHQNTNELSDIYEIFTYINPQDRTFAIKYCNGTIKKYSLKALPELLNQSKISLTMSISCVDTIVAHLSKLIIKNEKEIYYLHEKYDNFFIKLKAPYIEDPLSINILMTPIDTLPWYKFPNNFSIIIKSATDLIKEYAGSKICSLGQTGAWIVKAAELLTLKHDTGCTFEYIPFSGKFYKVISLNGIEQKPDIEYELCNSQVLEFYSQYYKTLTDLTLTPKDIIRYHNDTNSKVVILEFTSTGAGLASFMSILFNWSKATGLLEQFKKAIAIVILNDSEQEAQRIKSITVEKEKIEIKHFIIENSEGTHLMCLLANGVDEGEMSDRLVPNYPHTLWENPPLNITGNEEHISYLQEKLCSLIGGSTEFY